jgi:hypothetical protein
MGGVELKLSTVLALISSQMATILTGAGLTQGETLTQEALVTSTATLYWDIMAKGPVAGKKETYVTWNTISADPIAHTDNKVKMREAYVTLDIFTRKLRTASSISTLITSIETQVLANGWEMELSDPAQYEQDFRVTHISFDLSKKFTS